MRGKAPGIGGLEWMEGIPGEVGGALRMNAGAMGSETFDNVVQRALSRLAKAMPHTKTPAELEVHYRHVPSLERNYAVSAVFTRHGPAPREEIARKLAGVAAEAPHDAADRERAPGCIFKNPGPCPAGKLVDELGLKNMSVGNARVSDVHGNFIVNDGGATAVEVLELIEQDQSAPRARSAASSSRRKCKSWENRRDRSDAAKHIAVLKGGPGSERDGFARDGAGVTKALQLVRREGHRR